MAESQQAQALETPSSGAPSKTAIVKATLLALLVAAILLVTIVLPAEYGIDLLRTGNALGLIDLADTESAELRGPAEIVTLPGPEWAHVAQAAPYKQDTVEFTIGPQDGMEYKYRIEEGGGLMYSWTATAPIHYEFHAEPDDTPRGYAENFDTEDDSPSAHGTYVAPWPGIHGWYWENRTDEEVTIRLTTQGFFSAGLEFRPRSEIKTTFFDE